MCQAIRAKPHRECKAEVNSRFFQRCWCPDSIYRRWPYLYLLRRNLLWQCRFPDDRSHLYSSRWRFKDSDNIQLQVSCGMQARLMKIVLYNYFKIFKQLKHIHEHSNITQTCFICRNIRRFLNLKRYIENIVECLRRYRLIFISKKLSSYILI